MMLLWLQSGASGYLLKFYLNVLLIILGLVGIVFLFDFFRKKYLSTKFYEQKGDIFPPPPPVYNPFKPLFPSTKRIYPNLAFEQFYASNQRWMPVHDIFEHFEALLTDEEAGRYVLILSSPEMGKTSFADVIKQWQKSKGLKGKKVAYIPLSVAVARKKLHKLPKQRKTILVLDDFEVLLRRHPFPETVLKNWLNMTRKFELVILLSRMENLPKIVAVGDEPGWAGLEKALFNGYYFRVYRLKPNVEKKQDFGYNLQSFTGVGQEATLTEFANLPLARHYGVYLKKGKADNILEMLRSICENAANAMARKTKKDILPTDVIAFWQSAAVWCYQNRIQQKEPSLSNAQLNSLLEKHLPKLKQLPTLEPPIMAQNQLGNWQFKQKTFEEYLVFRQFLETPERFYGIAFSKPIQFFLWRYFKDEIADGRKLSQDWLENADLSHFLLKLPSQPYATAAMKDFANDDDFLKACLEKHPFFEAKYQPDGEGIAHLWQVEKLEKGRLISDFATGLMWELLTYRYRPVNYSQALLWQQNFNKHGFGGYGDWRLPTLEEALSLMSPVKYNGAHLPETLSDLRNRIWTINPNEDRIWIVDYQKGRALLAAKHTPQFVRLVRNFR